LLSMADLESIRARIVEGRSLEDVLKSFDWKKFEGIVAQILEENGFDVRRNVRFKTDRRYEIDVLGERNGTVLSIDCKDWSGGRYKKTALSRAAGRQAKRTMELVKTGHIKGKTISMLVTLFEEDIKQNDDVIIVPVWKLNSFLNNELTNTSN